jgi:hypothetical protein
MTITRTLKAQLNSSQIVNWLGADWGAFTRYANQKVASTLISMLDEGIDLALLGDSYKFMDEVERRSGVSEITDTEPRNIVCLTLREVRDGKIPMLRPDWHTDEDDEDEDE